MMHQPPAEHPQARDDESQDAAKIRPPYPAELYPGCPCWTCDSPTWLWFYRANGLFQRMSVCPTCGDKRCPGAHHHDLHRSAVTD